MNLFVSRIPIFRGITVSISLVVLKNCFLSKKSNGTALLNTNLLSRLLKPTIVIFNPLRLNP